MLSLPDMLDKIHALGEEGDELLTGLHRAFGPKLAQLVTATRHVRPLSNSLNKLLMRELTNLAEDLADLTNIGPLPDDVQTALDYYKEHGVR